MKTGADTVPQITEETSRMIFGSLTGLFKGMYRGVTDHFEHAA
jgi:hypothetical protein